MNESHAKKIKDKRHRRKRSHMRIRNRIQGTSERPRLAVNRSLRFIYAQVIDDLSGRTLVQANSAESALVSSVDGSPGSLEAAKAVGAALAERAKEEGIEKVVFDRGGYIYHGKIAALAEGAREKGLKF